MPNGNKDGLRVGLLLWSQKIGFPNTPAAGKTGQVALPLRGDLMRQPNGPARIHPSSVRGFVRCSWGRYVAAACFAATVVGCSGDDTNATGEPGGGAGTAAGNGGHAGNG